jgi:hypothetical protein
MAQQLGKINKRHKGKIMVPSLSIVSEQASACLLFVVFVYGASYNYFLAATGALGQKVDRLLWEDAALQISGIFSFKMSKKISYFMALVTLFVRMKEENQRVGEKLSLNGYATTVDTPEEQVAYSPTFGALSVENAW